ncbi:hypothetical protein V8B97DRAFT_2025818 [Scleroderma yunnanense]
MLASFPAPVLSVTADAVRDLQGHEALSGLWTLFTKCKESLQDGRRLENISWRLWHRELVHAHARAQSSSSSSAPTSSYFLIRNYTLRRIPVQVNGITALGLPSPTSDGDRDRPVVPTNVFASSIPLVLDTAVASLTTMTVTGTSSSLTRNLKSHCVGRVIVEMLPNHFDIPKPHPRVVSARPSASTSARIIIPINTTSPRNVGTSTTTTAPNTFPRVIVVNPTPHPTPPMTPIFGGTAASNDTPMLSQSTNLSPAAATTFPYSPVPDASVSLSSARPTDTDMCAILGGASVGVGVSMARTPGETRRFFLQQSPDDISPDRDEDKVHRKRDSSQESKNLCSPVSGGKSEMGAMSVVEDRDEGKIRRASLDGGAGGFGRGASRLLVGRRQRSRQGRHAHTASKTKMKTGGVVKERGKGKERLLAHGHGAGHVAPLMQKRSSMHEGEHQPYQQQHKAMFNIGSGSSGGSKSTQSTNAPVQTTMRGLIADTSVKPPLSLVATTTTTMVPGVNALPNGCASQMQQQSQQGRKTIVVASTSEEYETTDGSDSEWASEEIDDAEKKHRAKDSNNKLHATSTKTGHPSKPNATPKATEEETHLREAALEAQRQRDLFAKVPKRSYSNLNRTQSGLLSQLMNPNPVVFQVGHPYRPTRSSQDIGKMGLTMTQAQGQRSNSAFAAPTTRLSTSKSTAALPMAAQVFAISSSKPASSGVPRSADDNDKAGKNEKSGGYRPKGRPQEEEMEDDSEEENEHDQIPVSRSVAQEKLQALMTRRSSSQRQQQQQGERPGKDETVRTISGPVTSLTSTSSAVAMATPTPIPLGHPYNLPAPAPPMTPRTTRRRMLRTELSESMRRQLLWERQVSSTTNPAAAARRTSQGGLRPLATTTASESASPARGGAGSGANGTGELVNANEDREERRRRALSRNWTWADDYHFAGW